MADFFKQKNVRLIDYDGAECKINDFETDYSGNNRLVNFIRNNVIYEDKECSSVESYFYIKNSDNTQLFFPERLVTPRIPSQFLREALSVQCDTPEWNWKIGMSPEGRQKYGARVLKMAQLFKYGHEYQQEHNHDNDNSLIIPNFGNTGR